MYNRCTKSKKSSKLKHPINQRYGYSTSYNSPAKYSTSTITSGCQPKNPPNISYHFLQRKQHEIKTQYYISNNGKQNKNKMIKNYPVEKKIDQYSIVQTTERMREKRNTHHALNVNNLNGMSTNGYIGYSVSGNGHHHNGGNNNTNAQQSNCYEYGTASTYTSQNMINNNKKLLEVRKQPSYQQPYISNAQSYTSSSSFQQNQNLNTYNLNPKTVNKSKLRPRDPITLGSMRHQKKTHAVKHSTNMTNTSTVHPNNETKHEKFIKNKQLIQKKSNYIPDDQMCSLKCLENLTSGNITESNSSSVYYNTTTGLEESGILLKGNLGNSNNNGTSNAVDNKKKISILPNRKNGILRSPPMLSPKSPITKTPEQQIAQFQSKITEINQNFQHDSLTYMQTKDYQLNKNKNIICYLDNQQHFNWKNRVLIIDWMISVITDVNGKRQTLANSVNIFDRYLSLTQNIPLDHMQCIAASSMLIASKIQDKILSAYYLSQTTEYKYSADEILQDQYKILTRLGFFVNIPTLNSWANRLATQWDMYLGSKDLRGFDIIVKNIEQLSFKNSQQLKSYYNYRTLCQYVDAAMMDIHTLSYQPRMLSLGFIYIIMLMQLNLYTKQKIIGTFYQSSQFLLQKSTFNEFYAMFLRDTFGQDFYDLLPMIQYCSTFVVLRLDFELPKAIKQIEEFQEKIQYEQLCSFQTGNPYFKDAVLSKRNRRQY